MVCCWLLPVSWLLSWFIFKTWLLFCCNLVLIFVRHRKGRGSMICGPFLDICKAQWYLLIYFHRKRRCSMICGPFLDKFLLWTIVLHMIVRWQKQPSSFGEVLWMDGEMSLASMRMMLDCKMTIVFPLKEIGFVFFNES